MDKSDLEKCAERIADAIQQRVDYHNRDEVLDGIANMIDDAVDSVSNFAFAEERYLVGDFKGYLKRINGIDCWDLEMNNDDTVESCANRVYERDKENAGMNRRSIRLMNELAKDDGFVESQIGSNKILMWLSMAKRQREEEDL